ncbi:hypothetical protein BYT27DRAFT_7253684 [Phlegmacium glaucopus]|nr:hypothetical protein BYT27DRAFT_7253684 [Phlegmacium glaucopus]
MEPEQPPALPARSVPAPEEPSSAERLSLKRDFDRLFQKTLSDKKDLFAADGEIERKAALVELEEDLDNLGMLVTRLENRAAFSWNLRYMDMTPWITEFPPSTQSSIVKQIKASILRLHARIFELLPSTPLGDLEEDGSAGEEEGDVESEEAEVVPVSKGKSSMREAVVEPECSHVPNPVMTVSLILAQPITVVKRGKAAKLVEAEDDESVEEPAPKSLGLLSLLARGFKQKQVTKLPEAPPPPHPSKPPRFNLVGIVIPPLVKPHYREMGPPCSATPSVQSFATFLSGSASQDPNHALALLQIKYQASQEDLRLERERLALEQQRSVHQEAYYKRTLSEQQAKYEWELAEARKQRSSEEGKAK